jgi:chemotaxis protein MotB
MPRKHAVAGHENHERWLVSYADFITLMFAFFVVMFASSQADRAKIKRVAAAVTEALENGASRRNTKPTNPSEHDLAEGLKNLKVDPQPPRPGEAQAAELLPSLNYLNAQLRNEIASGKMRVTLEGRGLVVSLQQATFFPSGEDAIDPVTYPSLEKVATAIRQLPNPVRLEGHTDARPIHTARFRSNWDLSAARAIAVLDLLGNRFQVSLQRLAVAGYAETIPVATNDTEEGRSRNRRVDIVILSRQQLTNEPAPLAGTVSAPNKGPAPQPSNTKESHAKL